MYRKMTRRAAWFVIFIVGGSAAATTSAAENESREGKVFVGYVFRRPERINFCLYTHLCHAFVLADEDGTLRANRSCPSRELVADAHRANVRVLISLGGWGWDKQFAAIVSRPEAEDRYVSAVMKIVDEYDYDGIDLDWEYPDTEDEIVGYERLCRRFRQQLDELGQKKGRHLFQTMAAAANPPTLKWLTNELLLETMDWVNVMTYDMAGDWTPYAGHHSPLFASSKQPGTPRSTELAMRYLIDRGMPANRLAVGLPLYGKGFAVNEPYAATKKRAASARVPRGGNYSNIAKLIAEQGWTRRWDDETKNPWAVAPDGFAVIGYDDAQSIALKTEWAMRQGLRGVFFWQIGGDLLGDGTNPLQVAARKKLDEAEEKKAPPKPLYRIEPKTPQGLMELLKYTGEAIPLVSGHRGGAAVGFPENCIATFEHTLQNTFAMLEVDPRYTKDGAIVLHHDPSLERTTTGKGLVADHTLAELKQLRLKDIAGNVTDYEIPTLDDVLEWARGKAILVLDQKDVPAAARVKKIAEHKAEAYAMLIVPNFKDVQACYALNPNVMMEVMIPNREKMADFDKLGVPWKNVVAFVGHIPPEDTALYAAIHANGACCMIGTSRNLDRQVLGGQVAEIKQLEPAYRVFLNRGADLIETDIPAQLGPLLFRSAAVPASKKNYLEVK